MAILSRNTLHNRRWCFIFSNTTILYIILMTIQISLCSARPNQDNTMRQQIEETDSGVIKATEELPSSDITEMNPEITEGTGLPVDENEDIDDNDEDSDDICDDDTDEKCNEYTELPNLNHPSNSFTELKNRIKTSTVTTPIKPEHTTTETESTTREPEPTTTEPEPTTIQHESTTTEPEPTTTEPEPTTTQSEPTTTQPESTTEYQTSIDELHNDPITSTTGAPPVINEEAQLDSFTSTTEKFHFSIVLTATSKGSDHSKGSILKNCSFILFSILLFYRNFVN